MTLRSQTSAGPVPPGAGRATGRDATTAGGSPGPPTDDPARLLGIGEAATRLGVSERALRYYQQLGLLTPSGRTPGGMRRYSEQDLTRVTRIRELQNLLGFNLDEVRAVLDNEDRLAALRQEYRSPGTGRARRQELIREAIALQEALRMTVEAKLASLDRFRADLDASLARARALLETPRR